MRRRIHRYPILIDDGALAQARSIDRENRWRYRRDRHRYQVRISSRGSHLHLRAELTVDLIRDYRRELTVRCVQQLCGSSIEEHLRAAEAGGEPAVRSILRIHK